MRPRPHVFRWLLALGVLHVAVAAAGFFAPYDPVQQDRDHPYLAPMKVHLLDKSSHLHWRPFFYGVRPKEGSFEQFEEDPTQQFPVQFLFRGARYRILGLFPCSLHLFGAQGARFYVLGTDGFGRDQFSRILYGGQISLLSGLLGAAFTLSLGTLIGALAGFYGGTCDALLMRFAELFVALPWLYLLFALRAFLPLSVPAHQAFLLIVVVLAIAGWARPARLVRGIVYSVKERDFVRAARGFGAGNVYLLRNHILPETRGVLLTQGALLVPQFVFVEMTLSFVGLGIPEPAPSWGNLLSALQQYSVLVSYWWMYLPVLAIIPFFVGYQGLANALQPDAVPGKIEEQSGGGPL
jgi:peptide/nickel transport system permease protein